MEERDADRIIVAAMLAEMSPKRLRRLKRRLKRIKNALGAERGAGGRALEFAIAAVATAEREAARG